MNPSGALPSVRAPDAQRGRSEGGLEPGLPEVPMHNNHPLSRPVVRTRILQVPPWKALNAACPKATGSPWGSLGLGDKYTPDEHSGKGPCASLKKREYFSNLRGTVPGGWRSD